MSLSSRTIIEQRRSFWSAAMASAQSGSILGHCFTHPPKTSAQNGLLKVSEVTVDTPVTMRIERIDKLIGRLSDAELDSVDAALLIILDLTGA